jgi:hypothetical protein
VTKRAASWAAATAGLVQVPEVTEVTFISTTTRPNLQEESGVNDRLAPVRVRTVPPEVGPPRGVKEDTEKEGR